MKMNIECEYLREYYPIGFDRDISWCSELELALDQEKANDILCQVKTQQFLTFGRLPRVVHESSTFFDLT